MKTIGKLQTSTGYSLYHFYLKPVRTRSIWSRKTVIIHHDTKDVSVGAFPMGLYTIRILKSGHYSYGVAHRRIVTKSLRAACAAVYNKKPNQIEFNRGEGH